MRGAIPPLPQYNFMPWWSLKNTGITLLLLYIIVITTCDSKAQTTIAIPIGSVDNHMVSLSAAGNVSRTRMKQSVSLVLDATELPVLIFAGVC
jgi:hypothetical protein